MINWCVFIPSANYCGYILGMIMPELKVEYGEVGLCTFDKHSSFPDEINRKIIKGNANILYFALLKLVQST